MMDKLCLLFPRFTRQHLVKDVFLFAWHLSQQVELKLEIVYDHPEDIDFPSYSQCYFVNLRSGAEFNTRNALKAQRQYLQQHAGAIRLLMLFHLRWYSLWLAAYYKKQNRSGFVYLKGDMSWHEARQFRAGRGSPKQWLKQVVTFYLLPALDLISVETTQSYQLLTDNQWVKRRAKQIMYIANGIEPIQRETPSVPKQNMLLNVARIGSDEKNSQFLLKLLATVDLKQWTMIFLGSIEPSFQPFLDDFFIRHPQLRQKIQFMGHIENKAERDHYYQIAKVFLFSSFTESFGLALLEAAYFDNYLLTTEVGVAKDLLQKAHCKGEIMSLQLETASQQLQRIIDRDWHTPITNNLQSFYLDHVVNRVAQQFIRQQKKQNNASLPFEKVNHPFDKEPEK